MATLMPQLIQTFFDSNGALLVGGKIYTYQAATVTPLLTYQNQDESTANTNPVILDASGQCNMWLKDQAYKIRVYDASDNFLYERDDISHIGVGSISTADLADDSVSTIKIQASAVTTAKIDSAAVTTEKLAALSVIATKLAVDAVTTAKILDLNVTSAKIADGAITVAKLAAARTIQVRKYTQGVTENLPADCTFALAFGMGSGGGGGAGGTGNDAGNDGGGGGGGGGAAILTGPHPLNFVAGDSITIAIGASAGSAADGNNSTITGINGPVAAITFPGAARGASGSGANGGAGGATTVGSQIDKIITACAPGGVGGTVDPAAAVSANNAGAAPAYTLILGGSISAGAVGGTSNGAQPDDDHGAGGGGGGTSIFGVGGIGGQGAANPAGSPTAGSAAAIANYGAGGGGGGGGHEAGTQAGAAGGASAPGIVYIVCDTTTLWAGTV